MNIAVIGTGYVGLVSGACFAEFGTTVTCVDSDAAKVDSLQAGKVPIYEPGLEQLVARNTAAGRLRFSTDLEEAVRDNLVLFICVGTPQDPHGRADLSSVLAVAGSIAEAINGYKVIVIKSTVPVGTGDKVEALIAERSGGGHPFSVASNPEFLREGAALEDFMRPNRVVIGTEEEQARAILEDLYRPLYLIQTPILHTSRRTSELIKYASNAFLAVKISYINEMAALCEKVGADVHDIARGMGLDQRIGPKFLHPGPGYGGSCFPKDTQAILATAEEFGEPLRIIGAAVSVNDDQPRRMVNKLREAVGGELKGRTVAMLGLAFKPNTDDVRESAALKIAHQVRREGGRVRAFDPIAVETARAAGFDGEIGEDEYSTCRGADVVALVTEWNQFRNLDLQRLKEALARPVLVDMRNIYEREDVERQGLRYIAVGR
ncbi:MAG: UDP-glucose/GDP-mannose dehydrogenase family protein [Acidobacteriota bacterium]|nr:UDP-glucose/GDP-mannose dehydrogenase family protein [Acidobacteriota bacterium]MDQ7088591.1 UDP-glucose/GDP-mannose dehydrogenase family protein [Acidobacteriota bacterium]